MQERIPGFLSLPGFPLVAAGFGAGLLDVEVEVGLVVVEVDCEGEVEGTFEVCGCCVFGGEVKPGIAGKFVGVFE